jgi:hypothetical protein
MSDPLRVMLVTSWDTACGIAEHSAMLKEAVERADPGIAIMPDYAALDPGRFVHSDNPPAIVHLNYQAALHSRWTPETLQRLRTIGYKVVVTYHDTGVPNADQCKAIIDASDAAVVHEPFDDLPAEKTHYWRMGIPTWHKPQTAYLHDARPVVGTIGFPFGWKCQSKLIETAAGSGWTSLVIAPNATVEQVLEWLVIDPEMSIYTEFMPRHEAISLLSGCDATAFTYVTHNTGQSGAICLGIAARKPVVALATCRQFRALFDDWIGQRAIYWCRDFDHIQRTLHSIPIQRCDPGIVALAEQDSWTHLGENYARLYRSLV